MNTPDILAATAPVVEAFEQLGVPYHIGGSVASSLHGIPRLTIDVDLVADLRLGQVRPLVKQLEAAYYIDEDMIRDAIGHRSSFAVIPWIYVKSRYIYSSKKSSVLLHTPYSLFDLYGNRTG